MTRWAGIVCALALIFANSTASALTVSAQSSSGSVGQTVNVDIVLTNPTATAIDAFGFRMTYPSALIDFQSVSVSGTLTQSWIAVSGNETSPGVAQIGGFNLAPITTGGILLRVTFLVTTNVIGSGPLVLSNFVDDVTAATTVNATFQTAPVPGGAGLLGEYYNNSDFTGTLLQRIDPTIDFDWGSGSPDPSIGPSEFSVRWTGYVTPQFTQTYTFYTLTDDGVRLWVNGALLVNKWIDQPATEWSGSIALTAGVPVAIKMEFFELSFFAVAKLSWSSASEPKQIIPTNRLVAAACAQGLGDVDANGILGTSDVSCAFDVYLADQAALGACNYPTSCEVVASNVDCSGSVTPADARAIALRVAASLPPSSCFATPAPAPSPPYEIGIVQSVVDEGGTLRLEVRIVAEDGTGLDAFGARLAFPSAQLQFNRVEPGFHTGGWHTIDGRSNAAGQVTFGGFDPFITASPGLTDVCRLYFDFLGAPGTVAGLDLSNLVDDFTGAIVGTITAVDGNPRSPHRLHQNYPNPFNPTTQVRYDVGVATRVVIAIFDVRGSLVRTLVDDARTPGVYTAMWDGRSDRGDRAASGVYFCSMRAGEFVESRRMVLLK